jgi:hypothetical protein
MVLRARELFARAAASGRSVSWFAELAYSQLGEEVDLQASPDDLRIAERVHLRLRRLGFNGRGFGRATDRMLERLSDTTATPFEEGLTDLGRLLGYEADHPTGDNDPDSVWVASDGMVFVWEAKSNERSDGEIGARTAQQAAGHRAWVLNHRHLAADARVVTLLASDRGRATPAALLHAADVCVVSLDDVRRLAETTVSALARVRALGVKDDGAGLRSVIVDQLGEAGLLPTALGRALTARRLADFTPEG